MKLAQLQKQVSFSKKEFIHLLPVDTDNSFLGESLTVTNDQVEANLVLSIPEAIKEADKNDSAVSYFICLNNKVIGYAAIVFDETIPKEEDRYWLWQFTLDKHYQNRGYGSKALQLVIDQFDLHKVPVITLSTKPTNYIALHLYEKFGFILTGDVNDDEMVLKKFLDKKND